MLRTILTFLILLSGVQARALSHNPFNPLDWPYFPSEFDFQIYTLSTMECSGPGAVYDCDREWGYKFPSRAEFETALRVARSEIMLDPARAKEHFELARARNQVFVRLLRTTKADLGRTLGAGNIYDADLARMLARQGELLSRPLFEEYLNTQNALGDLAKYADIFARMYPAIDAAKSAGERHRAEINFAQSWQTIKRARLAELEARPDFNEYMSRVAWVAGNRFGIVSYYVKEGARRYSFDEFPWIDSLTLKSDTSCPENMVDFVRENMQRRLGIYFQQDITGEIDSIPDSTMKFRDTMDEVVNLTNPVERRQLVRLLKKKQIRIACSETKGQKDLMSLDLVAGVWTIPYHLEKESVSVPGVDIDSAEFEVPKYHFHGWPEVLRKAK